MLQVTMKQVKLLGASAQMWPQKPHHCAMSHTTGAFTMLTLSTKSHHEKIGQPNLGDNPRSIHSSNLRESNCLDEAPDSPAKTPNVAARNPTLWNKVGPPKREKQTNKQTNKMQKATNNATTITITRPLNWKKTFLDWLRVGIFQHGFAGNKRMNRLYNAAANGQEAAPLDLRYLLLLLLLLLLLVLLLLLLRRRLLLLRRRLRRLLRRLLLLHVFLLSGIGFWNGQQTASGRQWKG